MIGEIMKRNGIWILILLISLIIFNPNIGEYKTLLLIVCIESVALFLSSVAAYCYTTLDFTKVESNNNLGLIFLGVHICTGLSVLGVYFAQFSF